MPQCTYCGAPDGNQRDHIVPLAYTSLNRYYSVGELTPACQECNSLLGSNLFVTIATRAAYLFGVYQRRYKKLMRTPVWEAEELDELGPSLRSAVLLAAKELSSVTHRIEHLRAVAYRA